MQKLYGDSLRGDAGFVKVIKSVASKNARILESRAGRHAPELRRVAKEVKGTFDKVYEETAEVVEEFLAKCGLIPVSLLSYPDDKVPNSAPEDLGSDARHEGTFAAVEGAARHYVGLHFSPPQRCR